MGSGRRGRLLLKEGGSKKLASSEVHRALKGGGWHAQCPVFSFMYFGDMTPCHWSPDLQLILKRCECSVSVQLVFKISPRVWVGSGPRAMKDQLWAGNHGWVTEANEGNATDGEVNTAVYYHLLVWVPCLGCLSLPWRHLSSSNAFPWLSLSCCLWEHQSSCRLRPTSMASLYYKPLFRIVSPNMAISPALNLMSSIYKQNLESIKRRNLKTLGKTKPKNYYYYYYYF